MQDLGKEKYSFAYVVPRMLKDENAPVWKKVQRRWRSKKDFFGKNGENPFPLLTKL